MLVCILIDLFGHVCNSIWGFISKHQISFVTIVQNNSKLRQSHQIASAGESVYFVCESFTEVKWLLNDKNISVGNPNAAISHHQMLNYLNFTATAGVVGEYKCYGKDFLTNRYFVAKTELDVHCKYCSLASCMLITFCMLLQE